MSRSLTGLVLAAVAGLVATGACAQEPPALQGVSAPEKARLGALVEAAKKEGALTYWDVVIQPETNEALTAEFRKFYGLPDSLPGQLSAVRHRQPGHPRRAGDRAPTASPSISRRSARRPGCSSAPHKGDALEYDSPQYKFFEQAFENGLGKPKASSPSTAPICSCRCGTAPDSSSRASPGRTSSGVVPAGRISVGDVSKSVAYLATYAGLRKVLDVDYFKKLAEMKPSYLVRSEQIASRIVSGEDSDDLHRHADARLSEQPEGRELKFVFPEEGVVLLPQNMFILKKAPHPNAAKLWIDFILSERGQTILVKGEALISGRAGFKSPLPEYAPPIESLKVIPIDWQKLSTEELQKIRSEWVSIFNP